MAKNKWVAPVVSILVISAAVYAGIKLLPKLLNKGKDNKDQKTSNENKDSVLETANLKNYAVNTSGSSLNVRKSPSTSATIIGSFKKDSKFIGKEPVNGWIEVITDGKTYGYVSSQYAKEV